MMRLRGRRPVVLTPIANPASAEMLVTMAKALAPPDVSRVQLLSVVGLWRITDPRDALSRGIRDAQAVLGGALSTALDVDLRPEALITLHKDPWHEIARVAEASRCESLLLGVGHLDDSLMTGPLARLIGRVDADVVIMRAPRQWKPEQARRILIPSRGGRDQSAVRARLLGSLVRTAPRDIAYMGVVSAGVGGGVHKRAVRDLERLAWDEVGEEAHAELVMSATMWLGQVSKRAEERRPSHPGISPQGTPPRRLQQPHAQDRPGDHVPAGDDQPPAGRVRAAGHVAAHEGADAGEVGRGA